MGRDDARRVAGLQGGTAPARAFAEFMKVAVAKRPVEQFETQAPMPDWQLEPDEEAWGMNYVDSEPLVDADGNPLPGQPADPLAPRPGSEQVDQQWLDEVLRRNPDNRPPPTTPQQLPQPQQPVRNQPPRQPSEQPADPLQPRP
jgi:penicillin-binding protein 1A